MTSLNNPVKLPLDANGNVLANINAQNITPNAKATNVSVDANGNILANVNAQNINPNVNTAVSVTNPVSTIGILLSHQTGLSGTPSTANTPVNIGSAIAIGQNGLAIIEVSAHVSAGIGSIRIARTRSSVTEYINVNPSNDRSSVMNDSLFTDSGGTLNSGYGISATIATRQAKNGTSGISIAIDSTDALQIPVLNGDSLQFQVSNNTASDITYIDDLVVMIK